MDRRETFKANLRRLAERQGLDFDGLAHRLGYIRDRKKWLRRMWRDGLERLDERRWQDFVSLANFLGLDHPQMFWEESPDVSPRVFRKGNQLEFVKLVDEAWDFIRTIDTLRQEFPAELRDIIQKWAKVLLIENYVPTEWTPIDDEGNFLETPDVQVEWNEINNRWERRFVAAMMVNHSSIQDARTEFNQLIDDYNELGSVNLIVDELRHHPNWTAYEQKHGLGPIRRHLLTKWKQSKGSGVTPDHFARVFGQMFLDSE